MKKEKIHSISISDEDLRFLFEALKKVALSEKEYFVDIRKSVILREHIGQLLNATDKKTE